MTYEEITSRFSEACTAVVLKGQAVRDGNWAPIAHALRHFKEEGRAAFELVAEHGSTAILKVTPAEVQPPPGKSAAKRPAFLLILK